MTSNSADQYHEHLWGGVGGTRAECAPVLVRLSRCPVSQALPSAFTPTAQTRMASHSTRRPLSQARGAGGIPATPRVRPLCA